MIPNSILTRFQNDNRAVAPVIGIIILFGFLTIALAGYQAQAVPQQNAETEFQHYQDVQNDLIVVRNAISLAGQENQRQFESVRLGTTYRERIITLNPPDPAGTLRTEGPYNITIEGENTKTVETQFLRYQNGYNELNAEPIYYDNSALYLESEGGSRVFLEDQNLVRENGGTVVITALQREFSRSATGRVTLELYPTDAGDPLPTGEVDVTLPTRLPESYWSEQIEGAAPISNFGYNDRTDDVNQLEFTVNSEDLEFNTVGVDDEPDRTGAVSDINDGRSGGDGGDGGDNSDGGYINGNQSECVGVTGFDGSISYEINFEIKNNQTCESIVLYSFSLSYNRSGSGPTDFDQLSRGGDGNDPPKRDNEITVSPIGEDGQPGNATAGTKPDGFKFGSPVNEFDNRPTIESGQRAGISLGYFEDDSSNVVEFKRYEIQSTQPDGETHIQLTLNFQDSTGTKIYIVPTGGFNT